MNDDLLEIYRTSLPSKQFLAILEAGNQRVRDDRLLKEWGLASRDSLALARFAIALEEIEVYGA